MNILKSMEETSNKISQLQLHQYRELKQYEELEVRQSELLTETENENKLVEEQRTRLGALKELNVDQISSMQTQRK